MLKIVLGQLNSMSKEAPLSPLVLSPAYKDYLWGGSRINTQFKRGVSVTPLAESWEVSDREEGHSVIANPSSFLGQTLKGVFETKPQFFAPFKLKQFPLLNKLIDAKKNLSIQVHPNDEKASLYKGEPKTEMWYVVDAEEGSFIYLGLKKNLSAESLRQSIQDESLEQKMCKIRVKQGDCFYIPAGLFHAIGKGCLIYEVQQNSNTTYRVYDWGRKDASGQARPLHVEEALGVMLDNQVYSNLAQKQMLINEDHITYCQRLSSPYFDFYELMFSRPIPIETHQIFRHYFLLEGKLVVCVDKKRFEMQKGASFIIPAQTDRILFEPTSKEVILLETRPNISPSQE